MENLDLLQNLMLGEGGFLIKLRFGDGIELDQVEKIKELLKKLACEWRRKDYIPKKACDIFIDFYPAMEGTLTLYNDDEVNNITKIADEIMDLIRDCVCNY